MNDHTPEVTPSKQCSKCKEWKPATTEYFPRNKGRKDALDWFCKACASIQQRIWRESNRARRTEQRHAYTVANRESKAEYDRAYYAANKARKAKYYRAWRAANQASLIDYGDKWREANKEIKSKSDRAWRAANPERVAVSQRAYRARKRGAQGKHTAADITRQYNAQKGKCYYCGCDLGKRYTVDHIVPLSRGGSNDAENLVIACKSCNSSKNAKLLHEWTKGGRLL